MKVPETGQSVHKCLTLRGGTPEQTHILKKEEMRTEFHGQQKLRSLKPRRCGGRKKNHRGRFTSIKKSSKKGIRVDEPRVHEKSSYIARTAKKGRSMGSALEIKQNRRGGFMEG